MASALTGRRVVPSVVTGEHIQNRTISICSIAVKPARASTFDVGRSACRSDGEDPVEHLVINLHRALPIEVGADQFHARHT